MNIAVYGTLKKGFPLNKILARIGGHFKGTSIANGYALIKSEDLGYPFAVPDSRSTAVVEVWEIPDDGIDVLDQVEHVPVLFTREQVGVVIDGTTYDCQIYVASQVLRTIVINSNLKQIHTYE